MIKLVDVSKIYTMGDQSVHALDQVNLEIGEGEFVAIMGPSGSGKSTLLNVIGLLDTPDSGNFILYGKDVTQYSEDEVSTFRSQLIGFIFQQFYLMKRTTALDNVSLPHLYYKSPNARTAQEVLDIVGLGDRAQHRSNELSGGQQQRVAIARSLINSPKILFADEPTGNLDSKSESEILDILKKLHQEGMTIVMVTHEDHISQIASRVIRMKDGKIVSDTGASNNKILAKELTPSSARNVNLDFVWRNIQMALNYILVNKVRSLLSMFGILIGVAAVIAMLAIGAGAQESIKKQFASLGTNLLTVNPGAPRFGPTRVEGGKVTKLYPQDAEAIRTKISGIKGVSGVVNGGARLVYLNKNWSTQVTAAQADYQIVENIELQVGRFFTNEEDRYRERVAVIGLTVLKELFGEQNPIGEYIKVNDSRYQVIGVLKEKGSSGFRDEDDIMIIPLNTGMKRLFNKDDLSSIRVQVEQGYDLNEIENALSRLVIERNNLKKDEENSFNIRNMASFQEAMSGTINVLSYLLAMIAAISMLVGGIGIMNIMMVSVTERTREIGLRKAIGASRQAILLQFLVESVIISFSGGVLGVIFGALCAYIVSIVLSWNTIVTFNSILLSTCFAIGVGILFGIWPARKAAQLRPIDALRFE